MAIKSVKIHSYDFKKVSDALYDFAKRLKAAEKEMSKSVTEEGLKRLNDEYKNIYQDPNLTDIHTRLNETDRGFEVVAYGNDVIYAEFGTGDVGQDSPHENKKAEFNLNAYNSGQYIRNVSSLKTTGKAMKKVAEHGILSGNYWTYKKNGTVYYTQGVPAGKQMFNTTKYIRDGAGKKIIAEKLGEINDTFINSIKK